MQTETHHTENAPLCLVACLASWHHKQISHISPFCHIPDEKPKALELFGMHHGSPSHTEVAVFIGLLRPSSKHCEFMKCSGRRYRGSRSAKTFSPALKLQGYIRMNQNVIFQCFTSYCAVLLVVFRRASNTTINYSDNVNRYKNGVLMYRVCTQKNIDSVGAVFMSRVWSGLD